MAKIKFMTMFPYAVGLILVFTGHAFGQTCEMEGVDDIGWLAEYNYKTLDTHRGLIFTKTTTNINSIQRYVHITEGINNGPYLAANHTGNQFSVSFLPNFATYEQHESALSTTIQVVFLCADSSTRTITVRISINDTNNNNPEFLNDGVFEYKIKTPMSADFPISFMFGEMIVRDDDLTTFEITPQLDSTDLLKLSFNATQSPKNFRLDLRTNRHIMDIPDPITIGFTVTDRDRTGDQPRTSRGFIILSSDSSTQLLITPGFEDPFYRAVYENDAVKFEKSIIVNTGFDNNVTFSLENDDSRYFQISSEGNIVTIFVPTPIPNEIVQTKSLMLFTLLAKKEGLVGSTAIFVELPKGNGRLITVNSTCNVEQSFIVHF